MLHRSSKLALLLAPLVFQACNCGDNPPPPTAARIVSFNADPTSVLSGGTVTLNWTVIDATAISIVANPGGTLVDHDPSLDGSKVSMPITAQTVFVLTAFSDGG